MSAAITAQDKTALEQLAKLCSGGLTEDSIKQHCSQLTDDKIRRCALTIAYHPIYNNAWREERLRSLANSIFGSRDIDEESLTELLFQRMWAFKRVGAEKEMFIQYARPGFEARYLDTAFKLDLLCRRPGGERVPPGGQYSFWAPDISAPRLFCCGTGEYLDTRSEWSYGGAGWTRLKGDGRYGPRETNHPVRGRTFCCDELTTTREQPPIKDYVPCSLAEISAFLHRSFACFYNVTFPVENIRTEDCQHCQLYQHESEYILWDPSFLLSEDSYCKYRRALFFKNGVWAERRVMEDHSDLTSLTSNLRLSDDTWIIRSWGDRPGDLSTETLTRNGKTFKIVNFPTETSIELGMEFQRAVDGCGLNQLALRTLSPTMILPREAEQIIGFARQFLESRGFSAPLFRLLLAYWYPQAFTLPEEW